MAQPLSDSPARKDWSQQEVQLLVTNYFEMLEAELMGNPYKKSAQRKALEPQLSGRSKGSVEFKHQNVSAVLVEMGLPYVEGYKPLGNYQALLATAVESFLNAHSSLLGRLASSAVMNPTEAVAVPVTNLNQVIELPPDQISAPKPTGKPWLSRKGRRIDFVARDAANRRLGELGERFVLELEQQRLRTAGRDDLAQQVKWASVEYGDGLGYDILSYDEKTESERMIEVKSTGLGKYFPFMVTSNEVRCSEDIPDQFKLYRVFDLARTPRLFILHGSLRNVCELDPVLYRASM
jgi:hypothetical protein